MTTMQADELVDGYLRRLEIELGHLPAARRREIVDEIRRHIAEVRDGIVEESDVDVMNVLDRLGDPAEIAAEARGAEAPAASRRFGTLEVLALALTLLAWPIGVGLLWMSKAWTRREKLLGSLLPPAGYPGVFLVMSTFPRIDSMSRGHAALLHIAVGATLFTISLLLAIAPIGITFYLVTSLRARLTRRS